MPPDDERSAGDDGISDAEVRDELPADLDPRLAAVDYRIPDNGRRRIAAFVLFAAAALAALVRLLAGDDAVLANDGFLWAAAALAVFGAYTLAAAPHVAVDERDALLVATREVSFPVGHAAASLGWRGLRSRPTWRILLFSAEEPPRSRGLVLVDAVTGSVLGRVTEDSPEVDAG